ARVDLRAFDARALEELAHPQRTRRARGAVVDELQVRLGRGVAEQTGKLREEGADGPFVGPPFETEGRAFERDGAAFAAEAPDLPGRPENRLHLAIVEGGRPGLGPPAGREDGVPDR